MSRWTAKNIPDQTGRTVLVTGANSGLGLATADALSRAGAHVVLACRDVSKADEARRGIERRHPAATVEVRSLDLADLDSVRRCAGDLRGRRIDVLVNNAGIMAVPEVRSPQGHELQLATNVLGPFLLTGLLLPQVTDRVVWLSSLLHKVGRIALGDLDFRTRAYDPVAAYAQSKLADLMLAYELQRRLARAVSPQRSMAAHPGYSSTNLFAHMRFGPLDALAPAVNRFVGQPAARGALPTLFAATVVDLPGGTYVGPGGPLEMRGFPRPVRSTKTSRERDVAAALWQRCEELVGQEVPVPAPPVR